MLIHYVFLSFRKLLSKLEQLKDSGKDEKSSGKSKKDEKPSDLITYHLQTFPAQNKFIQTARLASLEQRINKLESVLGTTPDNLVIIFFSFFKIKEKFYFVFFYFINFQFFSILQNRLQLSEFTNVSEATKEISARVNLLDTNKLDKIEGRLGAVLAKMDALAEKKGGQGTLDQEKKVSQIFKNLFSRYFLSSLLSLSLFLSRIL